MTAQPIARPAYCNEADADEIDGALASIARSLATLGARVGARVGALEIPKGARP